jgi:hypothetical protein
MSTAVLVHLLQNLFSVTFCQEHRLSATQINKKDDSLEGKMAADPLKNKKMLNKSKIRVFFPHTSLPYHHHHPSPLQFLPERGVPQ